MQVSTAFLVALGLASCTTLSSPGPAAEHRVSSADGVAIAWEELGGGEPDGGRPALVFVHGWCGDRGVWRATMTELAPLHRVIALDLAGHGESGAGRERWTLASLADDVVAVVDASGAGSVILIGHSMGAPVALLAAPRLAPRVRGVIGVDSLHDADFAYPPGFLAEAASALETDFPVALEASFRAVVPASADPALVDWLLARAARTDRAAAIGLLRGLEGFDLATTLAAVSVPVRVVNAAPGEAGGLATRREVNRRLADFDALELEGVGHFPMLERPARFRPLLARWIEELSAPRSHTDHVSPDAR